MSSTRPGTLTRIKTAIEAGIPNATVTTSRTQPENKIVKLVVAIPGAQIRFEVTPVLRGSVFPAVLMTVTDSVQTAFGYPTDFNPMKQADLDRLSRRGEQLTHALIAAYQADL